MPAFLLEVVMRLLMGSDGNAQPIHPSWERNSHEMAPTTLLEQEIIVAQVVVQCVEVPLCRGSSTTMVGFKGM